MILLFQKVSLPIRLLLFLLITVIFGIVGSIVAAIGAIGKSTQMAHWCSRTWARLSLMLALVRVSVQQRERLDYAGIGPCVIVADHFSILDIIVLMAFLPMWAVWVVKSSLMKSPLFGMFLHCAGFIPTKRDGSSKDNLRVMERVRKTLKEISVLFFPEGTRSRDGEVGKFLGAPFIMALKANVPVIWVVLEGTDKLWPAGKLLPRSGGVTMSFGGVIPPGGFRGRPRAFSEYVRERIVRRLEEMRRAA